MSLNSSTLIEQYPLIFSRESDQRSKHASDGVFTERAADEEYSSSVCAAVRSRLGWLALFLVGLWGAAFVIDWFEHMLQRNVELAHFVPLIIGHGGNAGSQAVGSVIRALAAKELDPSLRATFARVVSRETLVGGLCGVALGALFLSVGLLCHLVSFHVGAAPSSTDGGGKGRGGAGTLTAAMDCVGGCRRVAASGLSLGQLRGGDPSSAGSAARIEPGADVGAADDHGHRLERAADLLSRRVGVLRLWRGAPPG